MRQGLCARGVMLGGTGLGCGGARRGAQGGVGWGGDGEVRRATAGCVSVVLLAEGISSNHSTFPLFCENQGMLFLGLYLLFLLGAISCTRRGDGSVGPSRKDIAILLNFSTLQLLLVNISVGTPQQQRE